MLTRHSNNRRSGIVLLVVMAMLALFAVVALSFVYYAEAEATASRYASQAQTQAQADVDPELLLSYYLSQLIYDTDNIYSAMRGHSLARNMYGYNYIRDSNGNNVPDWNVVPFNGVGRLRFRMPNGPIDNMLLINYQNFAGSPYAGRDPERDASGKYVGGNVHWTYPDLNNMFLAAVTADGDVLIPSFHRPWLAANFTGSIGDSSMTLRPHPSYHSDFSSPDWDGGGDVKNLEWGKGQIIGGSIGLNVGAHVNNDSIWMDLAFPVLTAPNGKRYKPMFAGLIVDLDNKINLYAHGNLMQGNNNASNMGWGPWEVNLTKVLSAGGEWTKLFNGSPIGRYGPDPLANPPAQSASRPEGTVQSALYNNKAPLANPAQQPLMIPPYYSKIDFGGLKGQAMFYPGNPGFPKSAIQTYPTFPVNWDNGTAVETTNHPAGYTPLVNGPTKNKAALVMSQIEALYRYQGTGSPGLTSDLFAQLPLNMQNPRTRWLSTLLSMDLDRPGLVPYNAVDLSQRTPAANYKYSATSVPASGVVGAASFPAAGTTAAGEFDTIGWRSNVYNQTTNQIRVLLNRDLAPYPVVVQIPPGVIPPPTAAQLAQINLAVTDRQAMAKELYGMLIKITGARDPNVVPGMDQSTATGLEYQAARWLAQIAVNIVDFIDEDDYMTPFQWNLASAPNDWLFGTELAHLVLNEVYAQLDNDASDVGDGTAANPGVWAASPKSRHVTVAPVGQPQKYNYRVNFWIELHNPMIATPPPPAGVPAVANYPRYSGTANLNEYRVVVTPAKSPQTYVNSNFDKDDQTNTPSRFFKFHEPGDNPPDLNEPIQSVPSPTGTVLLGTPAPTPTASFPVGNSIVNPANPITPYSTTPNMNQGFYVLGPKPPSGGPSNLPFVVDTIGKSRDPKLLVSTDAAGNNAALFPELSLPFAIPANAAAAQSLPYGVFLQRLANPSLPWQKLPGQPLYNPYVTIDYFDGVGIDPLNTNSALHMGVVYDKNGPIATPPAPNAWRSMGRKQPYLGANAFWAPTNLIPPPAANSPSPQTTFFRHNGQRVTMPTPVIPDSTLMVPFYWPVHLDRRLVNPLELVNVSCCRPWEYTQRFALTSTGMDIGPRGPWDQSTSLLYRLLETVQTSRFTSTVQTQAPPQGLGPTPAGGRMPGKININTIWDPEIFDALIDDTNVFSPQVPRGVPGVQLFKAFLDSRSPNLTNLDPATGAIKIIGTVGPTDEVTTAEGKTNQLNKPFKSLNVGVYPSGNSQYPNGLGIENTILRSNLFQRPDTVPATYPGGVPLAFKKNELLSKLFNKVTLRSNVFAVWLTVGFFEVTDESVYPVKLGKEIGRFENRHVRHRMFAIIDRTNLIAPDMKTTMLNQVSAGPQKLALTFNVTDTIGGQVKVKPMKFVQGMKLAIYDDLTKPPSEIVPIQGIDPNFQQITVVFARNHPPGAVVMPYSPTPPTPYGPNPPLPGSPVLNGVLGNPGPQEGTFDLRQNSLVVPYFSVIQ